MTLPLTNNLLLNALPPDSLERIAGAMKIDEVPVEHTVFGPDTRNDVFFPLDAVISLLRHFEDGTTVEIGMAGAEGLAGLNAVLGVTVSPHEGLIQGRGLVARIAPKTLRAAMQDDPRLTEVLHRYIDAFLGQTSQIAACNRLHVIPERLAMWLLLLHDRTGGDELSLTQEFLSRMLSVRRAGINEAMRELKTAGVIEHRRKRVRILNRELLEDMACSCYGSIVGEYERALGFRPRTPMRESPVD